MRLLADRFSCFRFKMANNFMFQHKHRILIAHSNGSFQWVRMLFFLDCPSPSSLYPFTQPLSAPVLGARPGFRQASVCSEPWQPATLLFLACCPTILETSQLFALLLYTTITLQPGWSPKDQRMHPR